VPLPLSHWEGERVYRRSLGLALLRAAARLPTPISLRFGGSIGLGQRVVVEGPAPPLDDLLEPLRASLRAVVAERETFRTELWPAEDAMRLLGRTGDRDAAKVVALSLSDSVPLLACGETRVLGPGPVVPDAGWLTDFSLARHEDGFMLLFRDTTPISRAPTAAMMLDVPTKRATDMAQAYSGWLRSLDITSVGRLAERCIEGKVSEVIDVAEGFHEKRVGEIASEIQRRGTVRAITIAGPSSSGKTTFLRRLRVQLAVTGIRAHLLSLDDYYVDRARTPKDEHDDYDYETFDALDIPLLHGHIAQILEGQPVRTARYDFTTGLSNRHGGPEISLGPGEVLLIEGIHGLHPRLFPGLHESTVFRVFVNPQTTLPIDRLTTVSASDLRLIRRIVRDRFQRGTTPADNIRRWPSVRRGEKRHIFPNLGLADAVFDSALVYEPAVLKVYADRYLLEVPRSDPTHATAHRLRGLLDAFVAIYPDHVPRTSLLREFIGGGSDGT
jgi:uridine kinase